MYVGPKRSLTVALSLLLVACGSVGETASAGVDESPSTPVPYSAGAGNTTTCTPSVPLGEPIAEPLSSFTCPSGWEPRTRKSALPISGRFTTAREMVDALCSPSADAPDAEPAVAGIDFEESDVIAVAYEGEIGMHRRGGELWIRHTETCDASYRTALFVVPKGIEPREQTCSTPCR